MRMPLLGSSALAPGCSTPRTCRDAEAALVQGAVIDPTALFTFGGLGAGARQRAGDECFRGARATRRSQL